MYGQSKPSVQRVANNAFEKFIDMSEVLQPSTRDIKVGFLRCLL